ALADRAKRGEFLICDSVPDAFLHGDGDKTGFLTQMRGIRFLAKGRNNLRYDDHGDVVARATDSALQEFAPRPMQGGQQNDPWEEAEEENYAPRSRYCAA
ncbi:MAG: hypothetical protein DRH30_12805, partial [Deltaproteobacteria bacterium]